MRALTTFWLGLMTSMHSAEFASNASRYNELMCPVWSLLVFKFRAAAIELIDAMNSGRALGCGVSPYQRRSFQLRHGGSGTRAHQACIAANVAQLRRQECPS